MNQALQPIHNLPAFQNLLNRLKTGIAPARLGLARAVRLPILAALYQAAPRPILLLTDRADRALVHLEELGLWLPDAPRLYFPEPNPLFYVNEPWGENTRRERLLTLSQLASYQIPGAPAPAAPPILIASARAIMSRTLPLRDFVKAVRPIRRGQTISPDTLLRQWLELGYEPANIVVAPGQFARRGGILDVWTPAEPAPVRLDFFGDEIESLRTFDPATQRTQTSLQRLLLTPAREILPNTQATGAEGCTEFHLPLLHPQPASLLDYLPSKALILLDDGLQWQETLHELEHQAEGLRKEAIRRGALPEDFPLPYLPPNDILDSIECRAALWLGPAGSADPEEPPSAAALHRAFTPGTRFAGRVKPFLDHLAELYQQGEQVIIVSRQNERLAELWRERQPTAPQGRITYEPQILAGSLSEGWVLTPEKTETATSPRVHLLTDGEIFGQQRPMPRQRRRAGASTAPESIYADLNAGDLVVHIDHGIGVFLGLVSRTLEGIENEYLQIEYADGAQLYVPIVQANRVTRYIGPDARQPALGQLGSPEWNNTRQRAREAVQEVAEDLLKLYARRQVVQGYAFPADTLWQQELEASFPYVETDDQLRVLAEVKRDMERARPMDRLICGDVGYGKTEIALRAAFKAVMDGKQVLILVPTTVLAQQHFETFRARLLPFPVTVEMLSRFRTPEEQREILRRLSLGQIDIVIGTHRLLSNDVEPKNLGLLIIDEEQRFGVAHKEQLKRLRTEVDVLTLTATPIPRTLYMALAGARDISTINTAPAERLPVITHVGPYDPQLVRRAILRELERGGQIFFVHNRVQTIGAMRAHLEKLVPEARVAVAHGQMAEGMLAKQMEAFGKGEVDVLLSTSIIESGLDIPNANTLIVDRADTFGLAQLYQLRGRVGRGAQRAYAFFFRHCKLPPTPDGRLRLETLAENTQLGAGLSIAMRDLEIRGAGDLLGTRQHGQIAAVGFHLYTQLLADAVRRLRVAEKHLRNGGSVDDSAAAADTHHPTGLTLSGAYRPQVSVDLPLPVSIPVAYVGDRQTRLRLYRRIADLRTLAEVDALREEFGDRFGTPPESVLNLFFQVRVRILAERAGVLGIAPEYKMLGLRFAPLPEHVSQRPFPPLGEDVRVGKNNLWLKVADNPQWRVRLVEVLQQLGQPRGMFEDKGEKNNQLLTKNTKTSV